MKIAIAGGGNIGTQFAVHCAAKGHDVIVYTSVPGLYNGHLSIVDDKGQVTLEGSIKEATDDPKRAFSDAELIFVTVPANLMEKLSDIIYANAPSETLIGIIPGSGGGECVFRKCLERGNTIFGLQRVPSVARLTEKGKTVRCTGYRDDLYVSALPRLRSSYCTELIEGIFDIKSIPIPDYLNLTLTPSNPILHTSRLSTMFKNWKAGKVYEKAPLFYEEWNDDASARLIAADDEVQAVCRALPEFDLKYVKSLKDHYESYSVEEMTKKISSIAAFQGIGSPMVKTEGGWIPDLHSRYFTADFSYGLTIIRQAAGFAGVHTPVIDDMLNWYRSIAVEKDEFRFGAHGITDRDGFVGFYEG